MRILVITQYYWPEYFQVTYECEELVRRGHSVTVLTGLPNYPSGSIQRDYRWGRNRRQRKNGVDIIRVPLIARGKNPLRLALNYHSFAWFSSRIIQKLPRDYDVVYVPEVSPVTMIEAAAKYKRLNGTPLLVYCCDLWPESLKNLLGNRLQWVVQMYSRISGRLYSSANLVPVQSPAFSDYLRDLHDIPASRTPFLPQFGDSEYLEMELFTPHKGVNFLVMGNMGRAQDIPVILGAVASMRHQSGFTVHFVGDGSCLEDARRFTEEHELKDRVILHGRKPHEDMPIYYSMADACILTLNGDSWIGTTVPTRLQGYMAAGKTVLAAVNGGSRDIIVESGCGECVPAGDSTGLAELLDRFIDNPEAFSACGQRGRTYFRGRFTKKIHMDSLERMLLELGGEASNG